MTALLPDEHYAVVAIEHHLYLRHDREQLTGRNDPPLELLDDGTIGVFLTIGYMQTLLREIGAHKTGEDYAAEIINVTLPRLGLIEPTEYVKKPHVCHSHPGDPRDTGGRHAQPSTSRSSWWRIFRLPTLSRILSPVAGAYSSGTPPTRPRVSASLVGLLRRQALVSGARRRRRFSPGSVQEAFWATGPP